MGVNSSLGEAICEAAACWQDPDHPERAEAVERTLEAPNRYTKEALAFAINRYMHQLSSPHCMQVEGPRVQQPHLVGVSCPEAPPLAGLPLVLAVLLSGHRPLISLAPSSPYLLPAFMGAVLQRRAHAARFASTEEMLEEADAVIAQKDPLNESADPAYAPLDIPAERQLLQKKGFSVAVIDGNESESEREGLAEDVLLFEGEGSSSVALIWAPRDLSPDLYLEAFAHFRGVFPAHQDTPGVLQMQRAFLEAGDVPHAYGEGLVFLLSKGEAEVQKPGHTRWTEYDQLQGVSEWLAEHQDVVHQVVAREQVKNRLQTVLPVRAVGEAHCTSFQHRRFKGLIEQLGKL